MTTENKIIALIFGTAFITLVALIVLMAHVQAVCLQRGYPTFNFTVTGHAYCTNQLTAVPL